MDDKELIKVLRRPVAKWQARYHTARNERGALVRQLEHEAQCQSLLRDERDALTAEVARLQQQTIDWQWKDSRELLAEHAALAIEADWLREELDARAAEVARLRGALKKVEFVAGWCPWCGMFEYHRFDCTRKIALTPELVPDWVLTALAPPTCDKGE